jgi:hypothetical protein
MLPLVKSALLVVVAIGAAFLAACGNGAESGPLAQEPGNSSYSISPAKPGQIVSFGLWLPRNPGPEAIIKSVEPADPAEAKGYSSAMRASSRTPAAASEPCTAGRPRVATEIS